MQLSSEEQRVVDAVADRREALVALTRELVGFDTVTHTPGAPPRDERALQEHVAVAACAPTAPRSSCTSPTRRRCGRIRWCPTT